ncbi:MAG: hypothetical protein QOE17_1696, partial [Gaiellales bacterium]|nr:hypothetical protein [Gaiellales bacterium]
VEVPAAVGFVMGVLAAATGVAIGRALRIPGRVGRG